MSTESVVPAPAIEPAEPMAVEEPGAALVDAPAPAAFTDPATVRRPWFWIGVAAIVGVQLAALWHVCSEQVERAAARHAEAQMQQLALADCLQYIPGSTLQNCLGRIPATDATQLAQEAPPVTGAVPVSYQFR